MANKYNNITEKLGKYKFEDNTFEDMTRYYFIKNDVLIIAGISTEMALNSLEIIIDKEIIKNRTESFNPIS